MAPFLESAALAVCGGATAILPLSRAGHAALLGLLFGLDVDLRVELACSAGVLLATLAFFRRAARGEAARIAIATLGFLSVALALREHLTAWGREPTLVGVSLLLSAIALASTVWAPDGDHDSPTLSGALVVGAVQGAAMLPGLSGPALGLASLLWLGVRAERGLSLCFLMVIPAEAALWLALSVGPGARASVPLAGGGEVLRSLALAALAGLAASLCLRLLQGAVVRRLLPLFSLYLVPLAVATIAWAYARP